MKSKTKFFIFLVFLIFSFIMVFVSSHLGIDQNTIAAIISFNRSLASFLYTVIFIVLATFSFSVSVLTSIGTVFFSKTEVIVYATLGIMASATIHFYMARILGREYVRNHIIKKGGKIESFDRVIGKDSFKTIFILSAIFVVPPTIPNFMGGILKINYSKYALATFLGNIPNTVLTVFAVEGFISANGIQAILSIIGLVLFSLIAAYFYSGELKDLLKISFPWAFRKQE